jgi:hypothetical protein
VGIGTSEAAREGAADITFTEDSDLGGFHKRRDCGGF